MDKQKHRKFIPNRNFRFQPKVLALAIILLLVNTGNVLGRFNSKFSNQILKDQSYKDSLFTEPYIDMDEWRNEPIRHRYVHGGFKGNDTKFSFYFPPKENYQGRFFQYITPTPDSETLSQKASTKESDKISFSISNGAYFIETNGGGPKSMAMPGMVGPEVRIILDFLFSN